MSVRVRLGVREIAGEAYSGLAAAVRAAVGPIALMALLSGLQAYGVARGGVPFRGLLFLLAVLLQVIILGAVFRARIGGREGRRGPLGLQWGSLEWRLLGVSAALYAFCAISAVILFALLMVAVVTGAGVTGLDTASTPDEVSAALGPGGLAAVTAAGLGVLVVIGYAAARLLPAYAATAVTGRFVFWRSWFLTSGNSWRVFAAVVLAYLPTAGVSLVGGMVSGGAGGEPAGSGAAMVYALLAAAAGVVQAPLMAGVAMAAYRRLAPEAQGETTVFG